MSSAVDPAVDSVVDSAVGSVADSAVDSDSAVLESWKGLVSVLTFSPSEVERHLQHAEEECRIMRSRGNIYFV